MMATVSTRWLGVTRAPSVPAAAAAAAGSCTAEPASTPPSPGAAPTRRSTWTTAGWSRRVPASGAGTQLIWFGIGFAVAMILRARVARRADPDAPAHPTRVVRGPDAPGAALSAEPWPIPALCPVTGGRTCYRDGCYHYHAIEDGRCAHPDGKPKRRRHRP